MNRQQVLILDFGGVLLNIDYTAPIREFAALGIPDFQNQFTKASQSDLVDEFEKGNISPEIFRKEIRNISGRAITDIEIDEAWNSILLDMPESKILLLEKLSSKYRLFLLSNTNEIHIAAFEREMDERYGKGVFQNFFENIYYSSRMGMRKPDAEIFQAVLNENNLAPEETIFIDDSIQHVEGAQRLNIDALHLNLEKEDLEGLLIRKGLI